MRIVIGIATTGDRPNELKHTLESLNEQTVKADLIHVHDNSKEIDYTDNGKFIILSHLPDEVYFFSCDDDILYPEDYIEKTIEAIDKHKTIVTYHGRNLRGKGLNYYHEHSAFRCDQSFIETKKIDVCGTGVTAFRTDYFNPTDIYKAEDKCMSDLVFSLEAIKQGKEITHVGHYGNWIIPQINSGSTIYDRFNKECSRQNEIADEIITLKNK
jgi:hypothetical protein